MSIKSIFSQLILTQLLESLNEYFTSHTMKTHPRTCEKCEIDIFVDACCDEVFQKFPCDKLQLLQFLGKILCDAFYWHVNRCINGYEYENKYVINFVIICQRSKH